MIIQVTLLDGNEVQFELEGKCSGDELLNKVTEHVQLTEKVELVSKELNHLSAIWHVYARGLNFMK